MMVGSRLIRQLCAKTCPIVIWEQVFAALCAVSQPLDIRAMIPWDGAPPQNPLIYSGRAHAQLSR